MEKRYRQEWTADMDDLLNWVTYHVGQEWIPCIVLTKDGDELPFPCELKKGRKYIIQTIK